MAQGENLLDILHLLLQRKKIIGLTTVIILIGSIAISLFLPVYFKSHTIFLAASPDQSMPDLAFGIGKREAEFYGGQGDMNRVLTVATSTDLQNMLIDKFDLYSHYKINPNGPKSSHKIKQKLKKLYTVSKTDKDALSISVEDTNPILAAEMANYARQTTDSLVKQLIKNSQSISINNYQNQIEEKETKITLLSDSLRFLRTQYGILNISAQSENLSNLAEETQAELTINRIKLETLKNQGFSDKDTLALLEGTARGQELLMEDLQLKLLKFSEGMPIISALSEEYADLTRILNYEKEGLRKLRTIYQSDTPATILVESASVPDIKSRPIRSLIVFISLAIGLFSISLGIVVFEKFPDHT
jgi:capsule polysaccharide export protein KpsE/RkpR